MSTQVLPARAAYDPFAALYDRHMGADFARRVFPFLERLLLGQIAPGARILDLCCGSGRVTARLAARGYRVLGLDASEPMLRLAQRNAPQAELALADARAFCVRPLFSAAVSTFNSLAHLPTYADLARVCANVRAALAPGGAWLFDLTMEAAYVAHWRGSYVMEDAQDCCVVRPSYDPQGRVARNEISVFHQRGGAWTRSDFTIFQKCHGAAEVRHALDSAGFSRIDEYDGERDLQVAGEAGRSFFLAS